jgi:K+-dependent Na+/Ca+ exchanger-like protein
MQNDQDEVPTASIAVWIGLTLATCLSFWGQAVVTEERFVPALNVVANLFSIPDDIAGATLMAAGASSPELFSSFVSLFITHSSLGLGTIVGSEIFNQLVICAGAVYAAKSGSLQLNPAILIREVGFYALGIGLLYYALRDSAPDPTDPSGENHIYISFGESALVFGGYVLYVIVCANMEKIVSLFDKGTTRRDGMAHYGAIGNFSKHVLVGSDIRHSVKIDSLPFLQNQSLAHQEPAENFHELYLGRMTERASIFQRTGSSTISEDVGNGSFGGSARGTSLLEKSLRHTDLFRLMVNEVKPSDQHGLYDMEINKVEGRLSCFMWQRSYFYNKARMATHGWHLRWFTLTNHKMVSVPDRTDFEKHRIVYPPFTEVSVDEARLIIRIENEVGKRNFYIMAPSAEILATVVQKMDDTMQGHEEVERRATNGTGDSEDLDATEAAEDHVPLIELPVGGSNMEIALFFLLFPLRYLIHHTIPDVRTLDHHGNPTATLPKALLASTSCLVWLIVGSYIMVASLEALAALMDIPDAVVGVTASAAGTSLPNYVASRVAAQNGFGNMAVSNAFGSNTFNIMVGLGLPWMLYTSIGTGFQPYHGLRDEGILQSVIVMASVLMVFVVLVSLSKFLLYRWHGIVFVMMYAGYLAFAIGQVYL